MYSVTQITTFVSDHDDVAVETEEILSAEGLRGNAVIVRHRSPHDVIDACGFSAVVIQTPPSPCAREPFSCYNEDRATPDVRKRALHSEMNVVCGRGHKSFCFAGRQTNVYSEENSSLRIDHFGAYLLAEGQ